MEIELEMKNGEIKKVKCVELFSADDGMIECHKFILYKTIEDLNKLLNNE